MNKVNGFLYGLLSSASFGLIPLFTIPAMQAGMQFESILFYRFLFACMALGGILLINGQSFRISRRDIPSLLLLAILYLMSAVFLFWGYKFMASGVATTIHFMYPVLTTLVMMLFFKEKKSGWRIAAIASAVIGVYFLSGGNTEQYQPSSAYQRMAYCRKSNLAGINPDRRFPSCTGQSSKKHRLHTHLCIGSYGAGNCRMCRHLPLWRSIHHKYWRRHCTDYRCCNGNYTETIRAAFL